MRLSTIYRRRVLLSAAIFTILAIFSSAQDREAELLALRNRCEQAYMDNDIRTLETTLEQHRDKLIEYAPSLDSTTFILETAHHLKLQGDYRYCLIDYAPTVQGRKDLADEADRLFNAALDAYAEPKSYVTPNDDRLFILLLEKAQTQYRVGNWAAALPCMDEVLSFREYSSNRRRFSSYRNYLETEANHALVLARNRLFERALEEIDEVIDETTAMRPSDPLLLEAWRKKAKILCLRAETEGWSEENDVEEAVLLYRTYYENTVSSLLETYPNLDETTREGLWMRLSPFIRDCYRTEDADPGFLYDVTLFRRTLLLEMSKRNSQYRRVGWREVQKGLPQGGCAIEFIQYEKGLGDDAYLAALVLGKKGDPVFVRLGKVSEFEGMHLDGAYTLLQCIEGDSYTLKNMLYRDPRVSSWIWNKDILAAISDAKTIYFSPDGTLHRLAVEYIYPKNGTVPTIHRLTSTKTLARGDSSTGGTKFASGAALFYGGIDYQGSASPLEGATERTFPNDGLAYNYLAQNGSHFANLVHTYEEAKGIMDARKNRRDLMLSDENATESSLRSIDKRYDIIHLATHGYFSAEGTGAQSSDIKVQTQDNSLSRSVVLLSGANSSLHNWKFDTSQDDGILSARELSQMDLSGVKLFVVSACQSGLGHVTADGVYGIQRGLKNAGAGAMILSLWSVGDRPTSILMQRMYQLLEKGYTLRNAFETARADLGDKYKRTVRLFDAGKMAGVRTEIEESFSDPCYSDAFILIDDL